MIELKHLEKKYENATPLIDVNTVIEDDKCCCRRVIRQQMPLDCRKKRWLYAFCER